MIGHKFWVGLAYSHPFLEEQVNFTALSEHQDLTL